MQLVQHQMGGKPQHDGHRLEDSQLHVFTRDDQKGQQTGAQRRGDAVPHAPVDGEAAKDFTNAKTNGEVEQASRQDHGLRRQPHAAGIGRTSTEASPRR